MSGKNFTMEDNLKSCLVKIKQYIKNELEQLEAEYKRIKGDEPPENYFSEVIEAINCVDSLQSIDNTIALYRIQLKKLKSSHQQK